MIKNRLRIHEPFQLEMKFDYPFKMEKPMTAYDVEAYFFIPGTLDVNKQTYSKKQFYQDVHNYVRFKTPSVKLGKIAGSGKKEKPLVKAGKKYHIMKAKGKLYPRTSGVAMNAVDHPFGSGRGRHAGKPLTAPRFAPPGRNVGKIKAKRTGKVR